MDVRKLASSGVVTLDGAIGTELMKVGFEAGNCPEALNIENPESVTAVHRAYVEAGAEIIFTNTFGANRRKLKEYGLEPGAVIRAGVKCAKEAGAAAVALDVGPIGELIRPLGGLSMMDAYDMFSEQAVIGQDSGVDCIWLETFTDLIEAKIAVLAVKEHSSLPVFCSMSFDETGRTFLGASLESCAVTISGLGVDGFGINCSVGPQVAEQFAERISKVTDKPIIIKPNAGMPTTDGDGYHDIRFSETPSRFAAHMEKAVKAGAALIGGCCGTTPAHIRALADVAVIYRYTKREPPKRVSAVCSAGVYLPINKALIIGERINPTGKPPAQKALREGRYDYFVKTAVEQMRAGASLLDVNVGLPGINEAQAMLETVDELRAVDAPLVIDSSKPEAIENGLRHACGKPILNSVSGENSSLEVMLPLAKKYGASIIGLTMDNRGIPKSAHERVMIAERIIDVAAGYGIPKEDVFIDCLTLTRSSGAEEAYDTIGALRTINRIGVKTVLGISNVSFGLPARGELNRAFLAFALSNGLDMPIINPQAPGIMETVVCYNMMRGFTGTDEYIKMFTSGYSASKPAAASNIEFSLADCVTSGMANHAKSAVNKLLENGADPMGIINNELMPLLDKIGRDFEEGKIFLPQMLSAAEAARAAFTVVYEKLPKQAESSGKIVLATVAGDVHDIGKNIVKAVLENYGFTIVDLGKNVAVSDVAEAVEREGARLVGLSALMTTTVENMAKTVTEIRARSPLAKIMVGGAVVSEAWAKTIGADYYGKDALAAAKIAKEVFSGFKTQ